MQRFTVPVAPVGKGRPRCLCIPAGRGKSKPRMYTPKATADFEAAVALACKHLRPVEGMCTVAIVAVLPRPKAPPKGTPAAEWRESPRRRWVGRYDADNIAKAVLDGMVGIIADDRQVVALDVQKWCAAAGESPCVEVTVSPLEAA